MSARRSLPVPARSGFLQSAAGSVAVSDLGSGPDVIARLGRHPVVLFVDTFTNYFEPDNAAAARRVLEAAGCTVHLAGRRGERPLCCGRTYLSAGMMDEARSEAERMLAALRVFIDHAVPVVGLEPSCLFTLRDEFLVQRLGDDANRLAALAMTFEQFLAGELDAGRLTLPLGPLQAGRALLHGHCHQKAFDAVRPIETLLARIPGLTVELIESSCCGMAGAFGYEAEHFEVSMQMGELSLLPAVRGAAAETMIIADGTSCRQQIRDGAQRDALHVARVLDLALAPA